MKPEDFEAMAEIFGEEPPDEVPAPPRGHCDGWTPDLNPTQLAIFNDPTDNILGHAEKGSGKSVGFCHKIVRHLYENKNAFYLIITPTIFTGKEGVWHDMDTLVLPTWRDGNRYPEFFIDGRPNPRAGELKDSGIGLEYTESRMDPETKDRHRWVANMFGGWSKMVLKSIPHCSMVEARVKGPSPSGVYVDELTNCNGVEYFTFPASQLGRRRDIRGPQQYLASCNPEGPSHWVYKTFWIDCAVEKGGRVWPDGVRRDSQYAVYHVPIAENRHRLPARYLESLDGRLKDPIERRRLLDGDWIDRPSGEAIFKDYFIPEIHVRGEAAKGIGLMPQKGIPVRIGHDPGPKNYSIHFEQILTVKGKSVWTCFDELNLVGQLTPYIKVVPLLLNRMQAWCDRVGHTFTFDHIADEAAFNQRNSKGSFDAADIKRISKGVVRMRPCPKGKDSVVARVQLLMALLLDEAFFVSDTCEKTKDMLLHLVSKKAKDGEYDPHQGLHPVRSQYIHAFDSLTYPPFKLAYSPSLLATAGEDRVKQEVYVAGGRSF